MSWDLRLQNILDEGVRFGWWKTFGLSLIVWVLIGFISSSRHYFSDLFQGKRLSLAALFGEAIICFILWALLTPTILGLSRRYPVTGGALIPRLSLHFVVGLLTAIVYSALETLVGAVQKGFHINAPEIWSGFQLIFTTGALPQIVTYGAIVSAGHILEYYRRQRERERKASEIELRTSQLESSLRQAQLDALRLQIHPHFLFNTLNTISFLMREDVEAANRLLIQLSELLRVAVRTEQQEIPLRQELDFLNRYLEIEQTRFQDRLSVEMQIEPETLDALAPALLLQPLVENAIKHGVAQSSDPGVVYVSARRENDFLEIKIRDNGPGFPAAETAGAETGVGLANTQARLKQIYNSDCRFEVGNAEDGGGLIAVSIPYRAAYVTRTDSFQSPYRG
ncbi:MAG TPA: histidine kinase [Blastocatellia bacterium]|nr:histidine kinase [Blastocatellia bacterium]